VACWLRRTPYVYFSADVLSSAVKGIGAHSLVVAAVRWLECRSVRGARGVLAVSDEVRREVVALGADPSRVAVVGTGIDNEQFTLEGPIAETGEPYFLYAGTMSEVHGAGVFLDAFASIGERHPEVRMRIFGAGVDVDELKDRSRPLGDRVVFSGLVGAAELAPWIRGAVASLASVRPERGYDFAFATKALTSLSCGTPVVYAGVGPLGPLVAENDLGWATPWDAVAVADAMEQALASRRHEPDRRLSDWVEQNHSLHAVAARATKAIDDWIRPSGRGDVLG
jgi:glycosyltransferase involved in cell wall biosynthesis